MQNSQQRLWRVCPQTLFESLWRKMDENNPISSLCLHLHRNKSQGKMMRLFFLCLKMSSDDHINELWLMLLIILNRILGMFLPFILAAFKSSVCASSFLPWFISRQADSGTHFRKKYVYYQLTDQEDKLQDLPVFDEICNTRKQHESNWIEKHNDCGKKLNLWWLSRLDSWWVKVDFLLCFFLTTSRKTRGTKHSPVPLHSTMSCSFSSFCFQNLILMFI